MSFFSRKKRHLSSNFLPTNGLAAQSTRQQSQQPPPFQSHAQQNQQQPSTSNSPATVGLTTSQSTQQHPPPPPPPPQQRPSPTTSQPQSHSPQANLQLPTPNSPPTDGLTTSQQHPPQQQPFPTRSQSHSHSPQANHEPWLLCTWSAHTPKPEQSPSPFPRHGHALTATATASGELFLFGGYIHESASDDLYVISTRDLSARQLRARGEVPGQRIGHAAVLTSTILLIWGGKTNFSDQNALNQRQDDSLNLLNLVSQEWTRVVVNGPGPGGRYFHTVTMVGSKFFVCGGQIGRKILNDLWAFDLNSLKSQPFWESYEPAPGDKKPFPRAGHVSVTTGKHIIIFGGNNGRHFCNDTWSFDISTRKWTELQCTGSIPSPRGGHAAVLVDNVMYVYGGWTIDKTVLDDLIALQLSTQRWFRFQNVGPDPGGRSCHAMASDGTRIFVLGGISSTGDRADETTHIHVFDTKDIKYLEPDPNAVNPSEMTIQLARASLVGPSTLEQPRHLTPSLLDAQTAYGASFQNAIPGELDRTVSLQMTCERNPGPNGLSSRPTGVNYEPRRVPEDDDGKSSTEYRAMFVAPGPYSGEVARLELERQLSVSLAAQTERDQRIAQLADELALKSALLEQAEANATEAKKHEGLKLRELQAKLDESLLSRDQHVRAFEQAQSALQKAYAYEQTGKYEIELAEVRAELETKKSELEAVRSRLTEAENGWTKSKADGNTDDNQVTRRLMERMRVIEAGMASKRWNEKSIEEMECRNEG